MGLASCPTSARTRRTSLNGYDMKTDAELDKIAGRIHGEVDMGMARPEFQRNARERLRNYAKAEIGAVLDEIERRAEANMLKTGKLEGMHYAALKDLRVELGIPRTPPFDDPSRWVCQCGQRANPASADWRWSGAVWQHHHGYPIGHVDAVKQCGPKG